MIYVAVFVVKITIIEKQMHSHKLSAMADNYAVDWCINRGLECIPCEKYLRVGCWWRRNGQLFPTTKKRFRVTWCPQEEPVWSQHRKAPYKVGSLYEIYQQLYHHNQPHHHISYSLCPQAGLWVKLSAFSSFNLRTVQNLAPCLLNMIVTNPSKSWWA